MDPPTQGIGATIRIGPEIQCLPYVGFLFQGDHLKTLIISYHFFIPANSTTDTETHTISHGEPHSFGQIDKRRSLINRQDPHICNLQSGKFLAYASECVNFH